MRATEADPDWLAPDWAQPAVGALMSTRAGGASRAPFDAMNLRDGLGDDPQAVAANRRRLRDTMGAEPVWLNQVHGARVVRIGRADVAREPLHEADASVTSEPGIACVVQVADCMPVLFAAANGRAVGAAHAGWRGLAAGVLEATSAAVCDAAGCGASELQAWLGPCIGPRRFEVGVDVLQAFGVDPQAPTTPRFTPHAAGGPGKWLADLPGLARERLSAVGLTQISGGAWCTVEDASRFFSFRRDRVTGRMAGAVWIRAR